MTISVPDTLTTDHSGKYKVSIRLQSGGLSFSGYVPSEGDNFFYREVSFDKATPYITSLQEFFFAHDFLSWGYKEVHVMVDTPQYTLVPDSVFQPARQEDLLSFVFANPPERALSNYLPDEMAHLVFGMEHEVYEFCTRSFVNPCFVHSLTPLLMLWKQQSRISIPRQMYVVLYEKRMDVVVFEQEKLLFINSFATEKHDDVLYYILYVWKQTGLDQQKDRLSLFGKMSLRQSVIQSLHIYLSNISPGEVPSEAYLLGAEIVQAPVDIIALSVCGL